MPRKLEQVLSTLYNSYFKEFPTQFRDTYYSELRKLKALEPDLDEAELTKKLFKMEPLSLIPSKKQEAIIKKDPNPMNALHFVERHLNSYKKYFKKKQWQKAIKTIWQSYHTPHRLPEIPPDLRSEKHSIRNSGKGQGASGFLEVSYVH